MKRVERQQTFITGIKQSAFALTAKNAAFY